MDSTTAVIDIVAPTEQPTDEPIITTTTTVQESPLLSPILSRTGLCDLSILAAVAPPASKGQHHNIGHRQRRLRRRPRPDPSHFCEMCFTISTPEWRKGPSGAKSLCNACGLKWAKQVRDGQAAMKDSQAHTGRMSISMLLNSDQAPLPGTAGVDQPVATIG